MVHIGSIRGYDDNATCPMALQSENVINCIRTDGYITVNATNLRPSPVNTKPAAAT